MRPDGRSHKKGRVTMRRAYDQRRETAFHEAAHAAVAYWFGWQVNPEGVEIDQRQYCGL